MSETLTTAEVAERLETDAKTLRKFFRSDACDVEPVGQGRRYVLTAKQADKLKSKFDSWAASKPARETKPASETGKKSTPAEKAPTKRTSRTRNKPAEVIEEEDDLDLDLDDEEPTDEDLDDLEDLELD